VIAHLVRRNPSKEKGIDLQHRICGFSLRFPCLRFEDGDVGVGGGGGGGGGEVLMLRL
jgi:hypothetical protein